MLYESIDKLLVEKITGEWGNEPNDDYYIKVIRTTNFTDDGFVDFSDVAKRDIPVDVVQRKKLKNGDIILEKSGGSDNRPVGRVIIFNNERENEAFLCNNFTQVLRFDTKRIFPLYALYYLLHLHSKGVTERYQNKTTGIRNLQTSSYLQQKMPVPYLVVQKEIATILAKAQSVIQKRKEAIQLADEYLKSVFLEMFGDLKINRNKFQEVCVADLCDPTDGIKCGPFGTQLHREDFIREGVPLWGIKHVNKRFQLPTSEYISEDKAKELEAYSLSPGDIVMTRKGTVGNCAIYPDSMQKGIMHSDLLRIRARHEKINPVYLTFQLQNSKNIEHQITVISSGAIMAGINVQKLKAIKVIVPPTELQNKFAEAVRKVEALKNQQQKSLEELETTFNSLMQRAFKGELA